MLSNRSDHKSKPDGRSVSGHKKPQIFAIVEVKFFVLLAEREEISIQMGLEIAQRKLDEAVPGILNNYRATESTFLTEITSEATDVLKYVVTTQPHAPFSAISHPYPEEVPNLSTICGLWRRIQEIPEWATQKQEVRNQDMKNVAS